MLQYETRALYGVTDLRIRGYTHSVVRWTHDGGDWTPVIIGYYPSIIDARRAIRAIKSASEG